MTTDIKYLRPFFEFDRFSEEIMENCGFEVTNFKMVSENHGDRVIITVDWNIPPMGPGSDRFSKPSTPSGHFPDVKWCKEKGHMSSGGHELAIHFFFSCLDSENKDTYRYSDEARAHNGFGKIGFDVGLQISQESPSWQSNYPELGYDYSHSRRTKYGVVVYFDKNRPNDPKPEKVLFHYDYEGGEMKIGGESLD